MGGPLPQGHGDPDLRGSGTRRDWHGSLPGCQAFWHRGGQLPVRPGWTGQAEDKIQAHGRHRQPAVRGHVRGG